MPDRLQPALTREEWASTRKSDQFPFEPGRITHDRDGTLTLGLPEGVTPQNVNHATAAICLYGQPFGFTRADVKLLREVAAIGYSVYSDDILFEEGQAADSLADRIEALLPPEKEGA